MGKFIVEEYEGQRIDLITGEIMEYSKHKSVVKTEKEPFFLTYSRQIIALYNSNVLNNTTKVLYKLLEFAEFNTGKVYMTSERVDELLETCGISESSYYRAINELIKIGIITKNKSTYTIAENMFWKGDRGMRESIINSKLGITFTPVFSDEQEDAHSDK